MKKYQPKSVVLLITKDGDVFTSQPIGGGIAKTEKTFNRIVDSLLNKGADFIDEIQLVPVSDEFVQTELVYKKEI